MSESHSFRIRADRWEKIKEKSWEISKKEDRFIKPTDVADAILWKYSDKITLEDIENVINARKSKT